MILRSIRVYGLFGEYDYDIELSGNYITFIHSQNGLGKSTLMRLISSILGGNMEEVASTSFDRIEMVFDDGAFLIVENRSDGPVAIIQKNEVDEVLLPEDLRSILKVTHLEPDRLVITRDECLIPSLCVLYEDFAERLKAAWADSTLHHVPRCDPEQMSDAEIEQGFKELKARLDFMKQAGFEPELPPGYRVPPPRFEIAEYRTEYTELFYSLNDYVERYHPLAELTVMYMDIVNSIFTRKTLHINDAGEFSILLDNGNNLPVPKLSSGEKQVLVIFFRLLFEAEPRSLVLIDEPEISLHIVWQHKVSRMLLEVARMRSLRMIVTTHSPQIIHDAWDQAVELKVGQ